MRFSLHHFLLRLDILMHPGWKIVTAGFERQPLVDFADWFAVSALFHEIQFPKAYKIIAKTELTEGIVDLVTNKWLSPNVIAEN
jgi:uncharacterized membrane-anchored protein YjiN (DUF445 family)